MKKYEEAEIQIKEWMKTASVEELTNIKQEIENYIQERAKFAIGQRVCYLYSGTTLEDINVIEGVISKLSIDTDGKIRYVVEFPSYRMSALDVLEDFLHLTTQDAINHYMSLNLS